MFYPLVWTYVLFSCSAWSRVTYYQTYYPDNRVFYHTSLSERSKACIPVDGPKEDVAAFMEWVLVNSDSLFTISLAEDHTSPTPYPETSQPPLASCTMEIRELTTDKRNWSAVMDELEPAMRM